MKKRIISLILALALCVGMLPAPAWAEEPTDPTQAVEVVGAANPSEETDPTTEPTEEETEPTEEETEPTEAETEPTEGETEPTEAPKAAEVPAEETAAPGEDEAVTAVQAMIDALPDVSDMSETYIDALETAYSAYEALSAAQQAQITGVEKLEALFGWVNSQVSTLATEETISGGVNWENKTSTTPVKLTGDTTLTLTGTNRIECDQPLDLNGFDLTIQGTGTLELVGKGGNNYRVGATLCDSTYTSSNSGGALTLAGGTVKVSGSDQNAVCVYNLKLNGGKLEAYGGSNAGIVCAILQTMSGSLYATGKDYGISMYYPCSYGAPVNKLTILVSNKKDADIAEMESANEKAIKNAGIEEFRTVYIGEVTGPMFSVKAQKGYLYEGVADQTATFAISAQKVDMTTLKAQWVGDHSGLTESLSDDGKTLTVTTDATVKQGTYSLTVTVTGTDGTQVSKTVTVTVLGGPITVTAQPKDASASCKKEELDAWQGDKEIKVTATLVAGLTGDISYQWKLEDDTVLVGFNQPTLSLKNLYSDKKLPQVADKPWLSSAKVYCTLTYGSHSVKTNAVTLTVNTCAHDRAKPDGTCQQCGEPCSSEPLLVREDGAYYAVDTSGIGDAEVGGGILTSGGTFYLTKDVLSRDMNAGNYTAGSENVILDLQDHTLNRLKMGNFPYGSFTLKNGTLGVIQTVAGGKLILENIHYKDTYISAQFELTVQGENTRFELPVVFHGTTHLRGGHFDGGLDSTCADRALELLDAGFAFRNDQGIVDASNPENLRGEIQVVAHTCKYVNGKCECGRSCDHAGTVDNNGYCTVCHALVVPYAIGEDRYTSLEDALTAANAGDTIILRGDFYQGSKTVEINKSVTLNLGGHTLTGDADGEPVLLILAENVTIQNGTVQNTRTAKSSPAVTVGETGAAVKAGLTVKDVTFIGSSDGNAPQQYALNIYNGHAKVESGIFNGGIFAQGDLTMTGGSTTRLKLGYVMGKVELSGGSFDCIRFNANADYARLLADGYAYQSGTGMVKLEDMNDSTAVQVVKCTHPDGLTADTACPYCGKKCGHKNINQTTGLCPECGYQMAASLTVDGKTTFFDTFPNAAAAANGKTGALLTLLKDEVVQNSISSSFGGGKITIDWKGHTLSGQPNRWNSVIALDGAAELTLRDSSGNNAGGIANQNSEAILVRGGSLTIESGTYASQVCIPANTTTVKIRGGIFKNDGLSSYDYAIDTEDGRYLAELMAPGYTLALDSDGTNLYDVYANKATPKHTNVYVVPHASHTFDESGKCACGATAPVQVEAGTGSSYFGDFESAVNQAKTLPGSTVRLRDNVTHSGDSGIYINSGTFIIDWNGHTLSGSSWNDLLVISDSANVTLKDRSGNNAGGVCNTGYGAAVCIAVRSGSVNIQGGTYSPNVTRSERCYGSVQISGGVFENPEDHGRNCALYNASGSLSGMLADGTAFAYEEDGSDLLKAYKVTMSDNYKTVYAVEHTHDSFDEDGVCACGYTCLHEDVTVNGGVYTCDNCGLTMTVMVETADGNVSYTTNLVGALNNAENGTTVKLLTHVNLGNDNQYVISGTLDLNGKNMAGTLHCKKGSNLQIVNRGSDMSGMERLEVWNGAKVTIADTAASIHFNVVWVESGSVADLLPEGGAYIAHDGTWISAADAAAIQSLEKVAVKEVPVKSVTLTANKTSVPYGESQTVTLSASATLSEGETASYAWSEVKSDGTVQTFTEEVGTSFTLPADVNAGEYTYRVSVTVGDYTLSEVIEITVTKAKGILENKDYPTEFTYGDPVPTPKAENFTSNHPDGTFSYRWLTGDGSIILETGANPTRAGTYMLYATWTAGTNYTTASLSLAVTIQKAAQTADITVVNETISGKGDGGVTLKPSADVYEIRMKGEATFEAISASQGETFHTLIPGVTYEIRRAETKNYLPTATQEVTVKPGRKLKVTLPGNPKGYTLTANKTELDYLDTLTLTFKLNPVGAYKTADFGIWAEAGSEKTKLTLGNDGAVTLTAPEKDITITVTGVKTDDREPKASIQGRQLTENSLAYVKWESFQENPADDFVNGDFLITASDRGSGVASIWYYLSDKPLTLEELKEMNGAFWVRPTNQGKVSITEDGEYYLYVKALDKANNAGYACTGKLVKESNPPTFSGVKDGETYYVTQQMEIHDDGMPDWYITNGSIGVVPNGGNKNPIKLRLKNDGRPYTFTVGDRCGNEATITVYMKPLTDLTARLYGILEESIQKSDRATLDEVEATLKGLDVTYATEPEKKEINDALAQIEKLRQVLDQVAAVEAQIDALPNSVEPYQQTVEDTQIKPARKAYSDLTDHQKTLVDSTKLDKLVRLEAQLNAWTITEGDGQIWYKGSWNPLSFTVNGQTRKFSKVLLDGKMHITATPSFLAVSGSIDEPFTLTLKPEFLQVSMKPGEHTLTVIYGENNSGTGTVTFNVEIPANYLDVTGKPEFDGKTTVTVDGKEYPIEEMNGTRYVNLPETGDLLTIYSFKDGTPAGSYTNYPTGMQVFRITRQEGGAKAEEITEFANLLNYAGCSIRLTGTKGIRMITGIGENARTALTGARGLGGYTLEEYGTVVMRGVGTPTLENSKSHNFAYKKGKADPIFSRANGMIQYTNVLVGFSLEDCKDTLTLRPYIKLKDMTTGETVTLYGGCVSRSIGYIAKQNENTYKPGTAGYKYIHEIIDAVYGKTEQGGEIK